MVTFLLLLKFYDWFLKCAAFTVSTREKKLKLAPEYSALARMFDPANTFIAS